MKHFKLILFSCALLFFGLSSTFAQNKKEVEKIEIPAFVVDEKTKLITYKGEEKASGNKDEVYAKVMKWANEFYPSVSSVIKSKDPVTGKISGGGKFNLKTKDEKTGAEGNGGLISYQLEIVAKEGGYSYEFTKINHKRSSYFGIENWVEENKKGYNAENASFLVQTDEYFKGLLENLKTSIK